MEDILWQGALADAGTIPLPIDTPSIIRMYDIIAIVYSNNVTLPTNVNLQFDYILTSHIGIGHHDQFGFGDKARFHFNILHSEIEVTYVNHLTFCEIIGIKFGQIVEPDVPGQW